LTNSLEEAHPDTGTLFASWLSREATEANYIKRDTPVMVVLGNPPYSVSSSNKGEWIQNLIADYKKNLNEKNINSLSDDYIKFIRYGQYFIEKNGEGILAYISNNSFIDGIIHRQMRKNLLEVFDKIYILDLHGNVNRKETAPDSSKDENVFDIQQGVSINLFIKNSTKKKGALADIYHSELFGLRAVKYDQLSLNSIGTIKWQKLGYQDSYFFFVPKNFEKRKEYRHFIKVNELFRVSGSGVKFRKDNLLVKNNFSEADVKQMVYDMQNLSKQSILQKYEFTETKDWSIEEQRIYFSSCQNTDIQKVQYRPFDYRYTFYPVEVISKIIPRGDSRKGLMQHFLSGKNIGLVIARQAVTDNWSHIQLSRNIIDNRIHYSNKGIPILAPLYIYPENSVQKTLSGVQEHTPNLNMNLVKQIAECLGLTFIPEKEERKGTFAPIDILDYIYAVLHSPSYRESYKEFLKIDFPRVPYPKDQETFWQLVKLGGELRSLHLLESPKVEQFITTYPQDGDNTITRKITKNDYETTDKQKQIGRVWINDTQYFDNVPQIAWEFYIGGYQPAQKWLKDRRGRQLNFDDILHYQKIIVALTETDRIMKEIDGINFME